MSRLDRPHASIEAAYALPQKHTKPRKAPSNAGQVKQLRSILTVFDKENSKVLLSEEWTDLPSILWSRLPKVTGSFEGDLELYTLLAIIVNLCIQSWYTTITADTSFTDDVLDIIVSSLQNIIARLAVVDLKTLLLEELPAIIDDHIQAVEYAVRINASVDNKDMSATFHTLRPHPIFDQQSSQDERALAWSQILVGKVLPLTLPSEEIANPSLRILVSEIFAGMIIYNGLYLKLCEPWFLWEIVTNVIHLQQSKPHHKTHQPNVRKTSSTLANSADRPALIHGIIQSVISAWYLLRYCWKVLNTWLETSMRVAFGASSHGKHDQATPETFNIIKLRMWLLLSHIMRLSLRMPWLYGMLAFFQWLLLHGSIIKMDKLGNTFSRVSTQYIDDLLTDSSLPPILLRSIRLAIFPGDSFAPARPIPTPSEIVRIKQECVKTVACAVPPIMRNTLFAASDSAALRDDMEKMIDVFAYASVNRSLVVSIVELIVVRLFPELE